MATCKDCLHYEACKGTYSSAKGDEDILYDFDGEMYAQSGCEDFEYKDLINRKNAVVEILNNVADGDEYISRLKISGYIGGVFTQVMTSGINDLPFTLSPSAYLKGYKDGLQKALYIVQNFEADVVIKSGEKCELNLTVIENFTERKEGVNNG